MTHTWSVESFVVVIWGRVDNTPFNSNLEFRYIDFIYVTVTCLSLFCSFYNGNKGKINKSIQFDVDWIYSIGIKGILIIY